MALGSTHKYTTHTVSTIILLAPASLHKTSVVFNGGARKNRKTIHNDLHLPNREDRNGTPCVYQYPSAQFRPRLDPAMPLQSLLVQVPRTPVDHGARGCVTSIYNPRIPTPTPSCPSAFLPVCVPFPLALTILPYPRYRNILFP